MKGQKLFVRSETDDDADELERFYSNEQATPPRRAETDNRSRGALIGKLVGDLVAHLTYTRDESSARIDSIHVARLLRRKRIGRFMISELARHAAGTGASRMEAPAECEAAAFFRTIGFLDSPDKQILVRPITTEEDP